MNTRQFYGRGNKDKDRDKDKDGSGKQEIMKKLKEKTACRDGGEVGHWAGDEECKNTKSSKSVDTKTVTSASPRSAT